MLQHDDWCFGILHEIGHVFNIGDTSWNWNDEMFANFRMHYALEKIMGKYIWMAEMENKYSQEERFWICIK